MDGDGNWAKLNQDVLVGRGRQWSVRQETRRYGVFRADPVYRRAWMRLPENMSVSDPTPPLIYHKAAWA